MYQFVIFPLGLNSANFSSDCFDELSLLMDGGSNWNIRELEIFVLLVFFF